MMPMLRRGNRRDPGRERELAALELLRRHGSEVLASARRYAATPEDAEDAYQRGLEILLTKAPDARRDDLLPWLKTVVKHEAFALRRQRERHAPVTDDGNLAERPDEVSAGDRAERLERLQQGAEALRGLKPQEVRALVLRAEGHSYREICAITGWTYTKVNRCLTEGRRAFTERVAGIHAGEECERLVPLLSAMADGEASAEELRELRPHLKTCLACRARLRDFRAAPRRVAALVPPAAALASEPASPLRGVAESLLGSAQDRVASLGERTHAATEVATGKKVAAVAASAAAIAGGGAGVESLSDPDRAPRPPPLEAEARPVGDELELPPSVAAPPAEASPSEPVTGDAEASEPLSSEPRLPAAAPAPAAGRSPRPASRPDPANEFVPGGGDAPSASSFDPGPAGGGAGGGSSGGGGEFGP